MLVLDRKVQEGFWIEGRIFVKVLSIGKRRVKLGIEAPSELEILRDELQSPPARALPSRNNHTTPSESVSGRKDPSG
ncbi:MAG: carbon storage regulator [Chloroflexi bacterium]|nr:carbon storage regulator [Chloroflexota bacterium]